MKRVLVIQQVPHEGLGIIAPLLKRYGFEADFLRVYKGGVVPAPHALRPVGHSAIIVLGGPMGVYEDHRYPFITGEIKLLEDALKRNTPVLGVCLGSQLLARAAGARVYKGDAKEIGFYRVRLSEEGRKDRLLIGLPDEFTVFQWHGDTFDVPAGGVNLASSELFPNQLIRVGPTAYGVQFHFEVTEAMIRQWVEVNADELDSVADYIDAGEILGRIHKDLALLTSYGASVVSRFLRMVTL